MKTRLQFSDIHEALAETEGRGGWFFARDDGTVFWFDHQHTISEVMQTEGSGRIGCRSYVADALTPEPDISTLLLHEIATHNSPSTYEVN